MTALQIITDKCALDGDRVSEQEADSYLTCALKASPILVDASAGKQAAIAIFIRRLGIEAYRDSKLQQYVDSSLWEHARMEILRWSRGVHNACLAQADLFGL